MRSLKGAARYRDSALTTAVEPASSPTTSRSAWSGSRRSPACWGLSRRAAWANKWMDPQNPGILRSNPCSILDACASSLCPQVHRAPLDAAKAPSLVWANVWWRMQAAGADTASIYPLPTPIPTPDPTPVSTPEPTSEPTPYIVFVEGNAKAQTEENTATSTQIEDDHPNDRLTAHTEDAALERRKGRPTCTGAPVTGTLEVAGGVDYLRTTDKLSAGTCRVLLTTKEIVGPLVLVYGPAFTNTHRGLEAGSLWGPDAYGTSYNSETGTTD